MCIRDSIEDMPTYKVTISGKQRSRILTSALHGILTTYNVQHAFIEKVHALPNNGATQAFSFGFGCGVIEGVVTACGIPHTYVAPQQWKKEMRCPKDKDAARMRASQLFPDHSDAWKLKKHDGRAVAALIALWGRDYTCPKHLSLIHI